MIPPQQEILHIAQHMPLKYCFRQQCLIYSVAHHHVTRLSIIKGFFKCSQENKSSLPKYTGQPVFVSFFCPGHKSLLLVLAWAGAHDDALVNPL